MDNSFSSEAVDTPATCMAPIHLALSPQALGATTTTMPCCNPELPPSPLSPLAPPSVPSAAPPWPMLLPPDLPVGTCVPEPLDPPLESPPPPKGALFESESDEQPTAKHSSTAGMSRSEVF